MILLMVALLVQSSLALTEKEQAELQRVVKKVNQVSKSLQKKKQSSRGVQAGFVKASLKKLTKARERLAKLPSEPEVDSVSDKLNALYSEINSISEAQGRDAELATKLLESPDYDGDREQLLALQYCYKKAGELDANSTKFGFGGVGYRIEELQSSLQTAREANQQFGELTQKWKPVLSVRGGRAAFIGEALRGALKEESNYQKAAQRFQAEAPALVESILTKAEKGAQNAVSAKSYDQFMENVAGPGNRARNLLTTLKTLGYSDAGFEARTKQSLAVLAGAEKTLAEALIARNTGPADRYQGGDRGQIESLLKAAWKKRYPGQQVVAVRISGGWDRNSGWKWDRSRKGWKRFDDSSIRVATFLVSSPTVVQWQWQWVHKFHLSGDKIVVSPFSLDEATPRRQMLRAKL